MFKLKVTFALIAICLAMVLSAPSDSDQTDSAFGNRRPSSTTKSPSSSSPSSSSPISSSPISSSPSSSKSSSSSPSSSSPISTSPKPYEDYSYYDEICPDYDLMEYDEDMSSSVKAPSTAAEL